MRPTLFSLLLLSVFTVHAQLNIDFNPHRNGNFSYYNSTTTVKGRDSLSFGMSYQYLGFSYSYHFRYLGQFKGNVMDGEGELRADGVVEGGFVYNGSFKDGRVVWFICRYIE